MVQPIGQSNFFGVDMSSAPLGYLTPDALLTYCQSRMGDLDTQIKSAFAQQQHSAKAGTAIRDLINCFGNCATNGFNMDNGRAGQDYIGALQCKINDLGANTPEGKRLIELRDSIADRMDPSHKLKGLLDSPDAYKQYWERANAGGWPNDTAMVKDLNDGQDPGGDKQIKPEEVKNWIENGLKAIQNDLNAGSEMGMIQLQSIMSQRQTALQLTTNLVQALGDQMKAIAGNIGK